MSIVLEQNGFYCGRLDPKNWDDVVLLWKLQTQSYKDIYDSGGDYELTKEQAKAAYDDEINDGPRPWYYVMLEPGMAHFALLQRDAEGTAYQNRRDNMVGVANIALPESKQGLELPVLQGSHIFLPYRGRNLSRLLYQARLEFLQRLGYEAAFTKILPENTISQKAAARYGFERLGYAPIGEDTGILYTCNNISAVLPHANPDFPDQREPF